MSSKVRTKATSSIRACCAGVLPHGTPQLCPYPRGNTAANRWRSATADRWVIRLIWAAVIGYPGNAMTMGVGVRRDESGGRWMTYDLVKPPDCTVPSMSRPLAAPWLGDPAARGLGAAEVPHATASATTTTRALGVDELGKAVFQLSQSNVIDLERQVEVGRDVSSFFGKPWVRHLAQVEQRLVVTEDHRFQFRVAVEAQAFDHGAVEVADQPVGQKKRPGPLRRDLLKALRTRVHLVAVGSAEARGADLVQQRLQLAGRPAVAIHDDELCVVGTQPVQLLAQLIDDARGIQVQERRYAIDIHVPAATVDDVFHLATERPADHQRCGAQETVSSCGKPSTEMNESLKSVRPDSSTYSLREGNYNATRRSRYERSAILAR